MEEKLSLLRQIYENSAEGILLLDKNAEIIWANRMIRIFAKIETQGINVLQIFDDSQNIEWPPVCDHPIRRQYKGVTIEYIVTLIPETEIYIASIRNLDATDGIKQEMEKEWQNTLSHFMHDIITPLNGIIGFVQITIENLEKKQDKENIDFLKIALSAAEKMLKNRNIFLAVNRIALGKYTLQKKRISLFELIKRNKELLEVAFPNVEISKKPIIEGSFEIEADEDLLDIALSNLLKNAAEEISRQKSSAKIIIVFGNENGEAIIKIINPGIIPEKEMEKLFKDNFTTKKDGNGLGLRAVRLIAEAHGGTVKAENKDGVIEITLRFPS
jgi:signal transduction histidine kinase